MAYKPPVQKSAGRGPKGKAKVEVKNDKVRVHLQEIGKDGEIISHEPFVLDKENCPESVRPGIWFVGMSEDMTKMYQIHPYSGMFEGHVKGFSAAKDKTPSPKVIPGKFGDYAVFYTLIEIDSPEANGMVLSYQLPYNFIEMEQEVKSEVKKVVGFSHPKSAFTVNLIEFLDTVGAWERGPMAYSDNILPKLEKRILEQAKHFKFVVKNGYIDTIYDASELPESEEVSSKTDGPEAF